MAGGAGAGAGCGDQGPVEAGAGHPALGDVGGARALVMVSQLQPTRSQTLTVVT